MTASFIVSGRFAVTPLAPIHIGTGDDYDPTTSVVDDAAGILYCFDPARAKLKTEVVRQLRMAVLSGQLARINQCYRANLDSFAPWADAIVPIGPKSRAYFNALMPSGMKKAKLVEIARTAWEYGPGGVSAFIPGSSLKGCMSTALQDRRNGGQKFSADDAKRLGTTSRQRLLGGDFENSLMRFVKVGDFHSPERSCMTRIYACRRFFKTDLSYTGVQACFEAVVPAQYRAFVGEIGLLAGAAKLSDRTDAYGEFKSVLKDLHDYHMLIWTEEEKLCVGEGEPWLRSVRTLLKSMEPSFAAGRAALVRLGKNVGAQSKTLHGQGVAQIQIRHRSRTQPNETLDHNTTFWATNEEDRFVEDKSRANGLPFGWAVIELLGDDDDPALGKWCRLQNEQPDVKEVLRRRAVAAEEARQARKCIEADLEKRAREEAERQAREQAELAEQAARQEALSAMTPERRLVEEVCTQLEKAAGTVKAGTELFVRVRSLLNEAVQWSNTEDKLALAQRIAPLLKSRQMYQGKAEKEFKKNLRVLRGEA